MPVQPRQPQHVGHGPVAVPAVSGPATLRVRRGVRLFRLTATAQPDGLLTLVISPIRLSRVIAQRLRRLRAIGRK